MSYLYELVNNNYLNFKLDNLEIGKDNFTIIAGPCAVESYEQFLDVVKNLKKENINIIRAGIFKPRTSPYSFQGLKEEGLKAILKIKNKYNIKIISEITTLDELDNFLKYVDIIQVGARNMQNFELLKALGKIDKLILLKRGFGNTIDEWLYASEYILKGGNERVILCERGIRTFETSTRSTLDLAGVCYAKTKTKLPIFIDPSHACGLRELVTPLSLASFASGVDGIMVEVHPDPDNALSDGRQSLDFNDFSNLVTKIYDLNKVIKKNIN